MRRTEGCGCCWRPGRLCPATPTLIECSQRLPPAELHPAGGQGEAGGDGEAAGGQAAGQVARGEELVVEQLVDGGAGGRVGPQHLLDEVCSHRVDVLRDGGSLEMGQGTMGFVTNEQGLQPREDTLAAELQCCIRQEGHKPREAELGSTENWLLKAPKA